MKKICILCIVFMLICLAVLMNLDTVRLWIPTDFSETELLKASESNTRYYYNTLTQDGKIAYSNILAQICNHPEEIEIPPLDEEEFHKMFQALSYDNPELLCMQNESRIISRGAKAYFAPQYVCDAQTCEAHTEQLEAELQKILIGVQAGWNDYQTELYFHDTICERMAYETADDTVGYTTYDALISGRAVCEGYARSMQLLCNRAGIPNYLVTGIGTERDSESQGHMWNVVAIAGQNYYVDTTWDDMDSESISRFSHAFFNVSEEDVQYTHTDILPENNRCIYSQYNYFTYEALQFSEYNPAAKARLTDIMKSVIARGENTFEIRFSDRQTFDAATADLIDDSEIYGLAQNANRNYMRKHPDIMYVCDEQMLTVQFVFV